MPDYMLKVSVRVSISRRRKAAMRTKNKLNFGVRSSVRHDYLTPDDFIQLLLNHLRRERFDIDVCCTLCNIPARHRFTELDNAFDQLWEGLCWMNPPCGGLLQKFCLMMLAAVERSDTECWALLPSRFPDYYVTEFKQNTTACVQGILRQASLVYVVPEWTFQFGLPDGGKTGKAKSSWWLCHFGKNGKEVLEKFMKEDPFKGTKYEGVLLCPAGV